ncbi:MAG: hypothetical protein IT379_14315 [Deltaproteobacteria bacterium]|nr:hypothetical protein [Deltaproteobacteria bacterium]
MRSSRLGFAFVLVAAGIVLSASSASAQVRVLMGVEMGAVVCADAAEVPEGGAACCASDADCMVGGDLTVSCAIAAGATEGVCVVVRAQENQDCTEQFGMPDMLGACFGAGGLPDGDCDEDGVPNIEDNCRCTANGDQLDCDQDGVGATCEAAPNSSLRIPRDACDGAQSYEEVECIRTMCGCYEIRDRENVWCESSACRALPSVARTVDVCPPIATDAGPRDASTPPADAGTPPRDSGTTPRDSGSGSPDTGAADSGGGGGGEDDGGCSAVSGADRSGVGWLVLAMGALGLALVRRRRRG